jgi:hypothetical protein
VKRKASTTARGYGIAHQRRRKMLAPLVAAGLATCARCGNQILPGQQFDLDHTDDRSGYLGPSHRLARDCPAGGNRATSKPKTRRHSRDW